MDKAIICDIDGTLANVNHRLCYVRQRPKDFKSFYAEMHKDTINEWCYSMLYTYCLHNYKIILMTGRPERLRNETEEWLKNNSIYYHILYMKKGEEHGIDHIIKKQIYKKHIEYKYNVEFVLEDRPIVCKMWRSLGLVCLQNNHVEF